MATTKYSPQSFFLTDYLKLTEMPLVADAFGPVKDFETTKYRTTSFVRIKSGTTEAEVYSISKGHIAILPGGTNKVNIVIKNSSMDYAPLKIKYFVYRGIRKSDLIDNNGKMIPFVINTGQPEILKVLWDNFHDHNGVTATDFPSSVLGYDESVANNSKLLDQVFVREKDFKFDGRTHLGYFTERLGLDIILDDGEYVLEHQQKTFELNIAYARAEDFVFDTSTMDTEIKKKRYKEHIHQFIDAAAFWGSHIKDGKIFSSDSVPDHSIVNIYDKFLNKYFTKNKVYVYIRNERNRSFNYYSAKRVLGYEADDLVSDINRNYSTFGWPILINKQPMSSAAIHPDFFDDEKDNDSNFPRAGVKLELECNIGNQGQGAVDTTNTYNNIIIPRDQYVSIYTFDYNDSKLSAYTFDSVNKFVNTPTTNIQNLYTYDYYVKYYKKGNDICGCFFMISTHIFQDVLPLMDYQNNLWIANVNTPHLSFETNNKAYRAVYDKNLNVNLKDAIKTGAVIQQETIFDIGKNLATGTSKKRRLYIASIKRSYWEENEIYASLNKDTGSSMFSNTINSLENYITFLYGNNSNFSIYRGSFKDGTNTIHSLSLIHKNNHWLKNSYFHLGITDEDYKQIFTSSNIQNTFSKSDNISFFLEEILNFSNDNIRKFKLGVAYENFVGTNKEKLFPTNEINVYTLDGMFFFSKDYSSHQEFFEEFSTSARVDFRPMINWTGEFGFDWVRVGDSGTKGDTLAGGGKPDRRYKSLIGNYYKSLTSNEKTKMKGTGAIFRPERKDYQTFINYNYFQYPAYVDTNYPSSWINLYPEKNTAGNITNYPKVNGTNRSCLIEGKLNLKIKIIDTITKLTLRFDKNIIDIIPTNSAEVGIKYTDDQFAYFDIKNLNNTDSGNLEITVKCIKETQNPSRISVLATGSNGTKLAGETILFANHSSLRQKIDIAFVNCKTDINGTEKSFTFLNNNSNSEYLKYLFLVERFLNQSLIEIGENKLFQFDLRSSATGADSYSSFNTDWQKRLDAGTVDDRLAVNFEKNNIFQGKEYEFQVYMRTRIRATLGTGRLPNRFFVVTCINEEGVENNNLEVYGASEAVTYKRNSVVLFRQGFYETTTPSIPTFTLGHELYHARGCDHSFSFEPRNTCIFDYSKSDNLMDYPHNYLADKIQSTGVWWFQRNFAIKNYDKRKV